MAKQRIVNTKFWDDSYVVRLSPTEKLVFLYLLTNPLTNISGVYELPLRRAAFDVGVPEEEIQEIVKNLEADKKLVYKNGWVVITNWIKYQTLNPKVKQGIVEELKKAPKTLTDSLPISYPWAMDTLSHLNLNSNTNLNPNGRKDMLWPGEKEGKTRHISEFLPKMP